MDDKRYNGWTNYETWNVALWLDNDEGTQTMFAERAQELLDDEAQQAADEEISADIGDLRAACTSPLADELENFVTDPELGGMPDLPASVYSDLLTHALGMVDWREIAEHYLSDIEPTKED